MLETAEIGCNMIDISALFSLLSTPNFRWSKNCQWTKKDLSAHQIELWVKSTRTTRHTFQSQAQKIQKKVYPGNISYIFPKIILFLNFGMELSNPKSKKPNQKNLKKFLIFFQTKFFTHILGWLLIKP